MMTYRPYPGPPTARGRASEGKWQLQRSPITVGITKRSQRSHETTCPSNVMDDALLDNVAVTIYAQHPIITHERSDVPGMRRAVITGLAR